MAPVSGGTPDRQPRWQVLALVLLGLALVAAYASIGRPLWIDEYAHFALGGLTPVEAMQAIVGTTGASLNQGHTGVYLFVDYWLLQAFGANLLALRLPSILSAMLLLASAVTFLRLKGFGFPWQVMILVAFAGQGSCMYYVGEARPYMPLAAASLACLAYYQFPMSQRHTWLAWTFGFLGIIGGSVSHPYFAVMGPAILLFSLWERGYLQRPRADRRAIAEFVNPRLVLPAVFLFVVVGLLTWAKGRPGNPVDPWYWMGSLGEGTVSFITSHAETLRPEWAPSALVAAVVAVALVIVIVRSGSAVWGPPLLLIALGILTSVLFTSMSVFGHYWVFMRQWIAGIAIVTLGLVWLLAAAWRSSGSGSRLVKGAVALLAAVMVAAAATQLMQSLNRSSEWDVAWQQIASESRSPSELSAGTPANEDWVRLGNLNVHRGGPVWREVSEYYLRLRKAG